MRGTSKKGTLKMKADIKRLKKIIKRQVRKFRVRNDKL